MPMNKSFQNNGPYIQFTLPLIWYENKLWFGFRKFKLTLIVWFWFGLVYLRINYKLFTCTFELIYKTYNNEGRVYTYSTGLKQHLYINHPEMVKELTQINTLNVGRITHVTKRLEPILGNGVITSNGSHWAHQRRIMAHEFTHDKIKVLLFFIWLFFKEKTRYFQYCLFGL